jgi:hypothetical protein
LLAFSIIVFAYTSFGSKKNDAEYMLSVWDKKAYNMGVRINTNGGEISQNPVPVNSTQPQLRCTGRFISGSTTNFVYSDRLTGESFISSESPCSFGFVRVFY